jgi:hypothetical protein
MVGGMPALDLDDFVRDYHQALDEFFRGNAEPAKRLYSHRPEASLANPFGPVVVGWADVAETMERAASNYAEGGGDRLRDIGVVRDSGHGVSG